MVARPFTVVQMLPELDAGGVERGTVELGAYLAERKHRSIVISAGGRLVSALARHGSRHISMPVGRKSPFTLGYIITLRKMLAREQVDVLHARSRVPAWVGYLTWKTMPKETRPLFITTFHGFYSVNRYSAVMTKGEHVIAISEEIAKHITEVYGLSRERMVVIHRGVDEDIFNPEKVNETRAQQLRERWQLTEGTNPVIMLPGRLTGWKGHEVFIDSLSRITDLPWMALCVGDTEDNRSFTNRLKKRITDNNLDTRIIITGHCDDMPAAYKLADIVVSAASTEPEAFGRVSVEAQAMGKTIIATAHGGSLETVLDGKTGRLIKPGDADALAAALRETLQSPLLRGKFGRNGRQWVLDNFTVQTMCRKTLSLYQRSLRDRAMSMDGKR